jgi:hypothetical protein
MGLCSASALEGLTPPVSRAHLSQTDCEPKLRRGKSVVLLNVAHDKRADLGAYNYPVQRRYCLEGWALLALATCAAVVSDKLHDLTLVISFYGSRMRTCGDTYGRLREFALEMISSFPEGRPNWYNTLRIGATYPLPNLLYYYYYYFAQEFFFRYFSTPKFFFRKGKMGEFFFIFEWKKFLGKKKAL